MKKYICVTVIIILILSSIIPIYADEMNSVLSGIYISQVDGTEYVFGDDGTLSWNGSDGKYVTLDNTVTIIVNGIANKYTYEVLDDLLILYDSTGQGIVYAKTETDGSPNDGNMNLELGSVVVLGGYEQDNNFDNGPEPIEWEVLAAEESKALLISKYGLDCLPYNEESIDVDWENCSLRQWLNNEFLNNSFSPEEAALILTTELLNTENPQYKTPGGNNTEDRVFIINLDEIQEYYHISKYDHNNKRTPLVCKFTEYAKEVYINNWAESGDYTIEKSQSTYKRRESEYGQNWCGWWLRSPGMFGNSAATINPDGSISSLFGIVNDNCCAVRPAIWVALDSGNIISVANEEEKTEAVPIQNTITVPDEETTTRTVDREEVEVSTTSSYHQEISTQNGQIIHAPIGERVAPLTIETSAVDNGIYYIYLLESNDNSIFSDSTGGNNMGFIVHGGTTCEIDVPLGTYKIYYGYGPAWYGSQYELGGNAQYYLCEGEFRFYEDAQYVNGHIITLYPVEDGNLETEPIDQKDFPG